MSRAAALLGAPSSALAIIVLRSYDRVISRRICRVLSEAELREQLEEVSRDTRSTGRKMLVIVPGAAADDNDDEDTAILGTRAYLIGSSHDK